MRNFRAENAVSGTVLSDNHSVCADKKQSQSRKPPRDSLERYSARDKPWDVHRAQTDDVCMLYSGNDGFHRYAERMSECSGVLSFGWCDDPDAGTSSLKLREATFCRVRHCPTCQWRRSLMWQARFYQALPQIVEAHPKARWLFVTLTIRNCEITELRDTLQAMNKAWHRLVKRKEFKPVLGWIRTTEVTRGADGSAHPHFHAMIMVPPSYFKGGNYIRHSKWVELWADVMRLDYLPNVDVRTVKARAPKEGQTAMNATAQALQGAVAETLKYSTKPSDMLADEGWFLELTKQTFKLRFIASGGVLKDVLKVERESDDDLAMTEGQAEQPDDGSRLAFNWRDNERRYKRWKRGDKAPKPDSDADHEYVVVKTDEKSPTDSDVADDDVKTNKEKAPITTALESVAAQSQAALAHYVFGVPAVSDNWPETPLLLMRDSKAERDRLKLIEMAVRDRQRS